MAETKSQLAVKRLPAYLSLLLGTTALFVLISFMSLILDNVHLSATFKHDAYLCLLISTTSFFIIGGTFHLVHGQGNFANPAVIYLRILSLSCMSMTLASMTTFGLMIKTLGDSLQLNNTLSPVLVYLPAVGVVASVFEVLWIYTPFTDMR